MIEQTKAGLSLMRFESLAGLPGLTHWVSTRHGGVSAAPFDSLNLGGGQDDPLKVTQNRQLLRLGLELPAMAWARQVHGVEIVEVGPDDNGSVGQADGLMTDAPGVGLLIKQADCQAVLLYAPRRRALANLHVGWRGNVQNMPGRGVERLCRRYDVMPAELHAAISPSLGPCCGQFVNWRDELPAWFTSFRVHEDRFDLVAVTASQLRQAGVPAANIQASGLCTRCDRRFFSYRRDGRTGRFGTVAAISWE